jgi:hypothetical protein
MYGPPHPRPARKLPRQADGRNAHLVKQIAELEQRIKDRNRFPANYVEELGLDMP